MRWELWVPTLITVCTATTIQDERLLDPKVHVTPGLFLRQVQDDVLTYHEATRLLFQVEVGTLQPMDFRHPKLQAHCDEDLNQVTCDLYEVLYQNIHHISSKVSLLQHTLRSQSKPAEQYNELNLLVPWDFANKKVKSTQPPVSSLSVPDTTPINFVEMKPVLQNLTSQLAGLNMAGLGGLAGRRRRQIELALAGTAAIAGYFGYKAFDYFHNTATAEEVYNKLSSVVAREHQSLVQLAATVNVNAKDDRRNWQNFQSKWNEFIRHENVTDQKKNSALNSLHQGELRQILFLSDLTHEVNRFLDVSTAQTMLSDCKANQLPLNGITVPILQKELNILQSSLQLTEYELLLPVEHVSAYYHYPLTTCKFNHSSTGYSLTIELKVPIQQKGTTIKLYEALTIPFVHQNHTCRVENVHGFIVQQDQHITVLEGSENTKCQPLKGFCKFSPFATDPLIGTDCTQALLKGSSEDDLAKLCPFVCRPLTTNNPTIIEVGINHFALSNIPNNTFLRCKTDPNPVDYPVLKGEHSIGTYVIHLPCSCVIDIPNYGLVKPSIPCYNTPLLPRTRILIPTRWSNVNPSLIAKALTIEQQLQSSSFTNLESIFNPEWNTSILPNITIPPLDLPVYSDINQHLIDFSHHYLAYVYLAWNTILTLVLLFLAHKVGGNRIALPFASVNYVPAARGLTDDALTLRLNTLILTIGILDIAIVAGFLILLYFYYKRKWTGRGLGCTTVPVETIQHQLHPLITARHQPASNPMYPEVPR
jgi:hypothetical protein